MSRDGAVDEDKRATLRRFAALGATAPFAGTATADAGDDDSETRSAITGYLSATPGAHFSKVRDDLQLGTGETQYHLRELVEDGVLVTEKDGDYRRYFPAGRFSPFERRALGALRRDTQRGILVELLRDPGRSGAALADVVGISRPAVSNHVNHLSEGGLVERNEGYRVRRPEIVAVLLIRYADSFGEEAAAFAADADDVLSYDP